MDDSGANPALAKAEHVARLVPTGFDPGEGFRINVRWGHLDRMARCKHGRVICSECGL